MEQKLLNGRNYYLPKDVSEVKTLVQQARQTKAQLRVTGANHSVNDAIYPDDEKSNIWVMLSHMNDVKIDNKKMTVDVEGGCHLGLDPFDPSGISTWENSLFYQLDAAGFALPDMGGIIHQSIAGFLSTGSSGGSTQYSFGESLLSLTFIPANSDDPEPVTVSIYDDNTDLFYAAGVSMGLFGIIISARFAIIPKFNIKGNESITSIGDCPIDMSGSGIAGKTSLQNFLSTTPYSRLLWYPQPGVERVTVWQAARMQPGDPFTRKPYEELPKILGSDAPAELAADLVYTGFGQYPTWLRNVMGGDNVPAYQEVKAFIDKNFYSTIFPVILPLFVTENKSKSPAGPQLFEDYWYSSLPMDNNMSDRLFPVEFTELWIPFDNSSGVDTVGKVLQALNQLFTDYYKNDPEISAGSFCTELYAAKASKFWMSPSYGSDVFRVDVFWFGHNAGSPADKYYPLFWKALQPFNFRCHWGKYLPAADGEQGVAYLQKQFPKWDDFLKLREQFDPLQVFVNDYWRQHLGISSPEKQSR
ncbi:MAG: FAD-binding protein [Flavisolibacter sp.]